MALITLDPSEAETLPTWRAAFSERSAELMAKLALLAYESDAVHLAEGLAAGGFTLVATFDRGVCQGFLAKGKDIAVLAFRGSDSFADWRTNLMSQQEPLTTHLGTVGVHTGFKRAFEEVGAEIRLAVNTYVPDTMGLYTTGHSFGAAMAQIASAVLERDNLAACYTFGAPRVGDLAFDRLVLCPHYRIIHGWDLVTTLPPPFLFSYRHSGDPRLLVRRGGPFLRHDRNPLAKLGQTLVGLGFLFFGNRRMFDDHKLEAYIAAIKAARALRGTARIGPVIG